VDLTLPVQIVKRVIDLLAGTLGLPLTAAIMPLLAAAIYFDSPGPIFYCQRRAGRLVGTAPFRFDEFEMVKLRTMRPDAERLTGPVLASEHDPRVTRVGRFLRKTRLDELPQLWNVLIGDMSLVGPRPERPDLLANLALAIPFFEERLRGVKPGITGLAQVSLGYTGRPEGGTAVAELSDTIANPYRVDEAAGAPADDMRMKMLFDLAYVASLDHFSTFLATELSVIVRTPLVMLRGVGR
jgi:lipopolysaccharide/colanic/teichoic acid biosynthesis glycosyltransferase